VLKRGRTEFSEPEPSGYGKKKGEKDSPHRKGGILCKFVGRADRITQFIIKFTPTPCCIPNDLEREERKSKKKKETSNKVSGKGGGSVDLKGGWVEMERSPQIMMEYDSAYQLLIQSGERKEDTSRRGPQRKKREEGGLGPGN